MSLPRTRRRRAGFTLVELMVGLVAGIVLLSSTWLLSRTSSRSFFRESRVATTQTAVRLAAEQIRRDVARAGFLSHPNTTTVSDCGQIISGDTAVRALTITEGTQTSGTNLTRNDALRLTGNYVTDDRYAVLGMNDLQTVVLNRDHEAFRRTFYALDGTTYDEDAFAAAFAPGRQVRFETFTPGRHVMFRRVVSVTEASATVQLDSALPSTPCVNESTSMNSYISPVSTIDYSVVDPTSDSRFANLIRSGAANGSKLTSILVRQEYNVGDTAMVAGSERSVLDYAVEFRMQALVCTVASLCTAPQLVLEDDLSALANSPETIQGLRFFLAARTPEVDPTVFHRARADLSSPLLTWDPVTAGNASGEGAARVRSTVFDVALINNR